MRFSCFKSYRYNYNALSLCNDHSDCSMSTSQIARAFGYSPTRDISLLDHSPGKCYSNESTPSQEEPQLASIEDSQHGDSIRHYHNDSLIDCHSISDNSSQVGNGSPSLNRQQPEFYQRFYRDIKENCKQAGAELGQAHCLA